MLLTKLAVTTTGDISVERHEKSKSHFSSLKSLVDLKKSIKSGRTMDAENENLIRLETESGGPL